MSPEQLIEQLKEQKKSIISDSSQLASVIDEILNKNKKAVEDFKKGKKESLGFLIGQVMQKTKGKADAKIVKKLLLEKL